MFRQLTHSPVKPTQSVNSLTLSHVKHAAAAASNHDSLVSGRLTVLASVQECLSTTAGATFEEAPRWRLDDQVHDLDDVMLIHGISVISSECSLFSSMLSTLASYGRLTP